MPSPASSFIDTLAFSSPPIPTVDHAKLLEELDLWTNAQFTIDLAEVPVENQTIIPLQAQLVATDELLLKYLNLDQQSIPAGTQQQQQQQQQQSTITPRIILPKVEHVDEKKSSSPTPHATSQASLDTASNAKKRTRVEEYASPAEEDKRRRNTAASARFRAKKKLREQAMEDAVKEMTSKSSKLEERVEELEREIRWLRSLLISEKATP